MSKRKSKVTLEVVGGNCEGVTGSCTRVNFLDRTILFECGGIQEGHTVLENYKRNSDMLKAIKPKSVDMIILAHSHYDHIGNVCAVIAKNSNVRIVAPVGSTAILREMWLDSANIYQRDSEYLSQKRGKVYEPPFTVDDVEVALQLIEEMPFNEIVQLDESVAIRYTPAGHILCSAQCEMFVTVDGSVRKILFTSDLGNTITQDSRFFVDKFAPVTKANIVIGEATYAKRGYDMTKKDFEKDKEKIRSVITQFCVDTKCRVLMPTFSLDRTPYVLWILYDMFGQDSTFQVPILVDSPLANRLLDCYSAIVAPEHQAQFKSMLTWKNIKRLITPEDSQDAMQNTHNAIIISSSGMLTAGRSVRWAQSVLPRACDCILFMGYAGEGTLAYKIKNSQNQKTITINGAQLKNKCSIVDLKSFSSHQQRRELINYYKGISCDKIYLVHSDNSNKLEFKTDLETELSICCKSTRVIATNKSTIIGL